MDHAFVAIVPTRPGPLFGRPVHRRGSPHRLRPGASPQALRIPPRGGHPALPDRHDRGQRGITPAFGYGALHPSARRTSTSRNTPLPGAHYGPLRLPTRPGAISAAPYTRLLSRLLTVAGLPWCPLELSPHAIPATPEGPRRPGSQSGHRDAGLPPPVMGSTPSLMLTRLHLGSLHATACGIAHVPSNVLVRELGASGYPWHLPQATRARCPLPGPDLHWRVPEYPRHTTGHHLHSKCLTLRRDENDSSEPAPGVYRATKAAVPTTRLVPQGGRWRLLLDRGLGG